MTGKITYRQQLTRCGKQRCRKCKEGSGHGPYWYAYWSENGRTVSKYIGAKLPEQVRVEQALENAKTFADPLASQLTSPVLRVYLLGQFRVERKLPLGEWQVMDGRLWQRRRARALLGCLLGSANRRLGREQVMDLLWPDLEVEIAANRLNGAVHELRQMLEPELERPAASHMLRLERDVLELAANSLIWVDAEVFENTIKEANITTDPLRARQLQEEAANLYRGSYLLEELYSEWAAQRRDALHRAWVGLLLDLAQRQAKQEEYANAIETLDRLRTTDPTNETALQHLMLLLTQRDRRGEALQVYRQHESLLKRDYEAEPLPETTELYEKLLKGHVPTLYTQKIEPVVVPTAPAPEPPEVELAFTRPLFQLGRHYQNSLIGREQELHTLQEVLYSLEQLASSSEPLSTHASAIPKPLSLHSKPTGIHTASRSRQRHIHFMLLRGEPGIGKTRLSEELSLEAYSRGWTVAWSRSYEQESSIPYHPWTDVLRTLFKSTSAFADLINQQKNTPAEHLIRERANASLKLERLSALLPDLEIINQADSKVAPPISHEQDRLHLWEAALSLIEAFSKQQPLLLVLDDLHWADESSIDLLAYLIHHFQDQPVLLIGTCRDGELAPQHKLRSLIADLQREQTITIVPVLPLSQTQIGTLVAHLPEDAVESIQSQAAGNPFFAEELARYVVTPHTGDLASLATQSRARPAASLPEAIAAVLERRLGRLSHGCQQLLGKAAVIGGLFELRQLLPMANEYDEDTVLDQLDEALHAGLLIEEGTGANISYHFWHPLIISHLYGRLSAARRAQLHRRAAEAFQTIATNQPEKIAATIVYHLSKGGGDPQLLAHYAEQSGNQAYALAAYAEAQQYYILVFQALNESSFRAPSHTDVHKYIQQVITKDSNQLPCTDPLHLCRMLERIAECSIILGDFTEGREVYEYILALRSSDRFKRHINASLSLAKNDRQSRLEAQIQALLWREIGNTWTYTSEYESANRCYKHGKEVMLQAGVTSGAAWACLHLQYGALLRLEGDYKQARRYLQEALTMLEEIVHDPLISPVVADNTIHRQSNHEFNYTDRALPLTRIERALTGDPLEIGYAHERLGIVAASLGEVNSALEHLNTALTIYEQSELVSEMARVCGNLGAVNIVKGAHDAARTYMQRALKLAERGGDLPNMTFVTHNLGDVAQRSGALQEAEGWFNQSLHLAEKINDRERISWSSISLASVQADLGNLPEAALNIQRAISTSRTIKSQRCIRYALLGLADLRITQAIAAQHLPDAKDRSIQITRLLLRAKTTLQKIITLEGLEIENIIDSKHLLALDHFLLGDLDTALEIAQQTLKEALRYETPRIIGRAYRLLGRILGAQKQPPQASYYFQQAIHICQEHGLRLDHGRSLYNYGLLLLNQSEQTRLTSPGLDYLKDASHLFRECHAALDLAATEQYIVQYTTEQQYTARK